MSEVRMKQYATADTLTKAEWEEAREAEKKKFQKEKASKK
jgi:hypothetical protein